MPYEALPVEETLRLLVVCNVHGGEPISNEVYKILMQMRSAGQLPPNIQVLSANPGAVASGARFVDENMAFSLGQPPDIKSRIYERRRAAVVYNLIRAFHPDVIVEVHETLGPSSAWVSTSSIDRRAEYPLWYPDRMPRGLQAAVFSGMQTIVGTSDTNLPALFPDEAVLLDIGPDSPFGRTTRRPADELVLTLLDMAHEYTVPLRDDHVNYFERLGSILLQHAWSDGVNPNICLPSSYLEQILGIHVGVMSVASNGWPAIDDTELRALYDPFAGELYLLRRVNGSWVRYGRATIDRIRRQLSEALADGLASYQREKEAVR